MALKHNRLVNNKEKIKKMLIKELTPILQERNIPFNEKILNWLDVFDNYPTIKKEHDRINIEYFCKAESWQLTINNDGKTSFSVGWCCF